jgi:transposase
MQFFVGIDVSLDSSSICIIDERGGVIKEGKADSDPIAIARFIRHRGRRVEHVGLETRLPFTARSRPPRQPSSN